MSEIETISWRELTGNKFVRGIDPAMLTERGYVKRAAIRRTGERKRTFFDIVYDREYLVQAIGRYICKQMFILGKEKTLELVSEAWDDYYPESTARAVEAARAINESYPKV
jgi:hypothetical protein